MVKASLIISVYKNVKDLEIILGALVYQSEKDFEIVISEDGDSKEMKYFIDNYRSTFKIIHVTHPDRGWRKNKALNNAIRSATSPYLIFIDGDCLLHPRFIEHHLRFSNPNRILGGKRLKLGPHFSQEIREGKLSLPQLERGLLWLVRALFKDRVKFFEEGVYIEPAGLLNFIAVKRRIRNLKGCNFSCYKEALIAINGFDEDYVRPAVGEDIDLTWRFIGLGYNLFSVRNYAVQYHLHHRENWSSQEENLELMREKQSEELFRCLNGLEKEQTVLEQDVYAKRSLSV